MRYVKFFAVFAAVALLAQFIFVIHAQAATWTGTGKLVYAAQEAYTLPDGRVFVPPTAFATVAVGPQIWDPVTRAWSATAPAAYARYGAAAALLADGRVLVTGGQASLTTGEVYDPVTNRWTLTGNLVLGRYFHRATTLADGRVLLTGGCIQLACGVATTQAEIYDPVTN